jgi:hypothetical protein
MKMTPMMANEIADRLVQTHPEFLEGKHAIVVRNEKNRQVYRQRWTEHRFFGVGTEQSQMARPQSPGRSQRPPDMLQKSDLSSSLRGTISTEILSALSLDRRIRFQKPVVAIYDRSRRCWSASTASLISTPQFAGTRYGWGQEGLL